MVAPSPISIQIDLSLEDLYTFVFSPPFGPFNSLHVHLITNAVGFTPGRVALYLAPLVFMYAQAYLLFTPGTRYTRIALGIACLSSMWSSWTGIRFTNPMHNGWNHAITMPYLQFMYKTIEFALLTGPIRDPYMPQRPLAVAAWGLVINSRMVGLGNIGLDTAPGVANAKVQKWTVERHLRYNVGWRPKSRLGSIARHVAYSALCYTVIDTIYQILPRLNPVFHNPYGGWGVLETFIRSPLYLLPGYLDVRLPAWILHMVVEAAVGITIWMFFEGFYHLFATVHIMLGWDIQAWDPNMFGSMWRADSLIDLWGTRWHQTFRHMFIVSANVTLKALHLPITAQSIFLTSFFYSGLIHFASEMAMNPNGSPFTLLFFFLVPGLGCALESTFKKMTGRKVKGVWGQIWTWTFMAIAGRGVATAWLASGYAGCRVTPPGGPGDYLAQAIATYVVGPGNL